MKEQIAAGAIIYSPSRNKFLLLLHRDGHWEFPKGKQEVGETLEQTRSREVLEESGLIGEYLGFSYIVEYRFYYREKIHKRVEYDILLSDGEPRISSEHQDVCWVTTVEVLEKIRFPEQQKLFETGVAFLRQKRIID